jgi:predicted Zn-dependent peptidase
MSKLTKFTLTNGLTVLVEKQPWAKGLSIGIWVKVGTRHEQLRESGISHFLEHMVFKGTEKRRADEITRAVERVGGEFNAFTTREYTCFHITLLQRDFEMGMEILSDIVMSSTFDPEELEREKKVILQEIASTHENPEELAHDIFYELIFGRHGLGRSILGNENSIRKMKRKDLIRVFREYYRPENMIISVVGNVTIPRLKKSLHALRKKIWPGRRMEKKGVRRALSAAPKIREGLWWVKRPTDQAHIVWGVESPKYTHRDQPAILLLASYLGGGMSSYLFQEIREKNGLAYSIYSNLNTYFDSGVLSVYAATNPSQVPMCLRLIEEAIQKLCTVPLAEEDLNEVNESLKGTLLLSCDSVESVMQANAIDQIYFDKTFSVEDVCEELDGVTPKDVMRVARKVFGPGKRSILVYGSKPSLSIRKKLNPIFPKR